MNDRKLLEMAAKAAGLTGCGLFWDEPSQAMWDGEGLWFDPLTDDGDALRLAVKLHMACSFEESRMFVEIRDGFGAFAEKHDYRRAIVRAAAEIGRAMP